MIFPWQTSGDSALEKVRDSEALFYQMAEYSPFPIAIIDSMGLYEYINTKFTEIFGYTLEDIPDGKEWFKLAYPDPEYRREAISAWFSDIKKFGKKEVRPREFKVRCKDGTIRDILFRPVTMQNEKQFITYEDLTERKIVEKALLESEARYRALVEDMPALICLFLPDGTLTFVNSSYCSYFNKKSEELIGQDFFQFIPEQDQEKVRKNIKSLSYNKPAITYEHQVVTADGKIRWQRWTDRALFDEKRHLIQYQSIGYDITEQKLAEHELRRLSYRDALTGIANRRYFEVILDREWRRAARELKPLSILICDIDCFKAYNDTYGHQKGDRCLKQVAEAIVSTLRRPLDLAARYGGEEFIIVMPDTNQKGSAAVSEVLRSEVEALGIEHISSPVDKRVTISLGVATTIPGRDSSPDELISAADEALYQAKQEGRNRVKRGSLAKKNCIV